MSGVSPDYASHFNEKAVPTTPSWFPASTAGLSKSALYTLYNTNVAHQIFGYGAGPDPANADALRSLIAGSGGKPLTVAQINAAFGEPAANGASTTLAHAQAEPTLAQRGSGLSHDSTAPGTSGAFNPSTNPAPGGGGAFSGVASGIGPAVMSAGSGIGIGTIAIAAAVLLGIYLVMSGGKRK